MISFRYFSVLIFGLTEILVACVGGLCGLQRPGVMMLLAIFAWPA